MNLFGVHSKVEYMQNPAFSMQTCLEYLGEYTLMGLYSHNRAGFVGPFEPPKEAGQGRARDMVV